MVHGPGSINGETPGLISSFNYLKRYNLKIEKHTIIDEKNPFVLYALEI